MAKPRDNSRLPAAPSIEDDARAGAAPATIAARTRRQADPHSATALPDDDESRTDDEPAEPARRVSRNLVWSLTAGGSSMVVHLAGLLALGLIILSAPPRPEVRLVQSSIPIERPQDDLVQRLSKPITPSMNDFAAAPSVRDSNERIGTVGLRGAAARVVTPPKAAARSIARSANARADVGPVNLLATSAVELGKDVSHGIEGQQLAGARDYGEAMDRITQEILNKLARGKVLVVWVMDQSESMNDDRAEIMARIERVYVELGFSTDGAPSKYGDALLTAVASYGAGFTVHTAKPTSTPSEIVAALKSVPNDPTGAEMMCQAVTSSVLHHQKFAQQGGRQLMVVLVTDESGDPVTNVSQLESTIQTCRNLRAPVYVLGREAVFGYPYAHIHWIDPDTKIPFWLRIDRGPETPYAEQLQIDGIHRRFDAHPSGFGPYEQSRLARQTGGIFFLLPTPEANLWRRDDRTYDPESMRPYLPELTARHDYAAERDKHPLRSALFKVISDLNPYDARGEVKADSPAQVRFWDWPTDRDKFAAEANYNLKKARTLLDYLAKAQAALEEVRKHRDREPSLRWRANYDVTYAQTIAYQARMHEYIAYIGAFIHNPKPIKNEFGPSRPTNSWDGHYVTRTLVDDPNVKAMRERSTELYRKVIEDHPGTPWAARAEYELKRGFGCDLHEDYEDPRRPTVKPPTI